MYVFLSPPCCLRSCRVSDTPSARSLEVRFNLRGSLYGWIYHPPSLRMINFISGKYCVPPDVLSAADNHLLRGDSRDVIGWVRQRLLGEWRSWREVLRGGRKQLIPGLHLKKFVLVYGHVGATPPHPHAQIRQM